MAAGGLGGGGGTLATVTQSNLILGIIASILVGLGGAFGAYSKTKSCNGRSGRGSGSGRGPSGPGDGGDRDRDAFIIIITTIVGSGFLSVLGQTNVAVAVWSLALVGLAIF